jgi:transglutaminase-like putative cysteine protease
MQKLFFTLCFLCFTLFAFTQEAELKFGKISPSEWNMEYCKFDSTASAVILMEQCFIHFSGEKAYLRVHRRIKILDDKGFEYSNLSIPYYHHDRREYITGFKGVTYIKNDKGKVQKVNAKETFKEKINDYWSEFKVPFPAIQKGAIIEYKYEFVTANLMALQPWEFQHEIPTVYSALSVQLPSYLKYKILGFGNQYKTKYDTGDRNEWVLENLPGYKDEDFVYNPKDYIDQVRFQAHSVYTKLGWENILQDWDELGADMLSEHYNKLFRKASRKKELLNSITLEGDSDLEKVKKIFEYVRSTYRWNGYYSIYPARTATEFLETNSGNFADINLWLVGLLQAAGLSADPVLISTRSHGKPVNNFPLLSQFNIVICAVMAGGEELLLDAVPRGGILPYDHLPLEDLNYKGLKIKSKATEWIKIPFSDDSKSQALIELDFTSGEGKMKLRYKGYPAAEKRYDLVQGRDIFQKVIFENFTGEEIKVKLLEIQNADQLEENLEIDYAMELVDIKNLDIIYFNPAIWTNWKQTLFNKAERTLPVELPYPFIDQVAIKVLLPEGYRLIEAPEGVRLTLPDNLGYFTYSINNEENHMLINMRLKVSGVYMSPEVYFNLKDFFEQISQKVNEVLVFGKEQ